ncbi:cation:proton antiporter [Nonomuraea sp. NPDC005650]|uniref:cation:proton antiporter n=1 Tax=Nonomuraea sp. NPDC005650 TaxID=3157045 RepID=UPI0033BBA4E0
MILAYAPIPPITAHQSLVFLLQIGLLLVTALLLGRLATRLSMPAVAGELCAGVLLGPSIFEQVAPGTAAWVFPASPEQLHLVDGIGQVGVLLLVGLAGMSMDVGLIRRKGLSVAWVSAGGLLVPLGLGVATGFLLPAVLLADGAAGDRTVFAWFLGVAMCVSAIPVIAKTLLELRLLHRNVGQLIISAAAVDDFVGWLLLSVVAAMATGGVDPATVARSIGMLLLAVLIAATIGRLVVNGALRLSARTPEPGVMLAVAVAVIVLFSAATQAAGMEPIVGAMFGGVLIGSSGWVDRERLAPLRRFVVAVLAPIFFAAAGLRMDLTALADLDVLLAALAVLAVAVIGKFAGVYGAARLARLGRWESLALGAGLNARGVIEVVIAMTGLRLGVLSPAMYTIVILVAVATSLMAPLFLRFTVRRIPVTEEENEREAMMAAT